MFYLYALGSMAGYALQNVLLAHHARKMDGLSLAFYRNISFVVTLLPLLIGASREEITGVLAEWPLLLMAGGAGGISLGLFYAAYKYLTVGIAGALSRAVMTVILTGFGWIVLHETLSLPALGLILLIIVSSIALGTARNTHAHLRKGASIGILFVTVGAFFLAGTNAVPIILSRTVNPLVAGYFWEVSIGIAAGVLILLRWLTVRQGLQHVNVRAFTGIALCSWPTLVGTGLYTLALRTGPVAVVTSILSASLVVVSLLGWWLYRERLTAMQWGAIFVVLTGVVGLKFV